MKISEMNWMDVEAAVAPRVGPLPAGVRVVAIMQQHRELVAAEATEHIAVAEVVIEQPGEASNQI